MPLTEPVVGLFTEEWDRFRKGVIGLRDVERLELEKQARAAKADPSGKVLISLPGWSEILRLQTPYQPSVEDAQEYYRAQRQKRAPDLPQFVTQELQRRQAVKERIARSPAPAYAQSFGSVLTAIDNVQDFMSTVSTFGRLSLWAGTRAVQTILPGATRGTAQAIAEVAARRAAATAGAEFAATVAQRAAAGNLVARLALNNPALFAVAEREAVRAAAARAFTLAFDRALLGVAGRLAARFVPVLGWVILASDLLNLLSFFAMMATPMYALLCEGPSKAVAAGVPAALFKQALKRESWRAHKLNPFSLKATAARAFRAGPRLPGFSNLVEVAQTTDQLFGMGLSLGGGVGLIQDLSFGLAAQAEGREVEFRGWPEIARQAPQIEAGRPQADPALRKLLQQAGHVLTVAPSMFAVQEHFTEDEHLLAAFAVHQATALLRWYYAGSALPELLPSFLEARVRPPLAVSPDTAAWAEATGRDLRQGRRWWFDDAPEWTTGQRYAEFHTRAVPGALGDFLRPRRNAPLAALYGGLVTETTEGLWLLAEDDPHLFRWELTTDARLVSDFTESGFLVPVGVDADALWRMWQAARAELERTEATSLRPGRWEQLAAAAGVQLLPVLPESRAVPAAWQPGLEEVPDG